MNTLSGFRILLCLALALLPEPANAEITVSAAASLANVLKDIVVEFRVVHPELRVNLNLGPTGALLQQVRSGAPVDALVLASAADMDRAQTEGLILQESRRNVAGNRLVLAVPKANPAGIREPFDLISPKVQRIGIANPATAPAGRYARQALEALGLWIGLADKFIIGETVRQILDYAVRGEVDAAFVFATDAHSAAGKVETAVVLEGHEPVRYPAAVTAASGNPDPARRFVEFLSGDIARRLFKKHRFALPGDGNGD